MKLIKSKDGTLKCECRVDFVITHNKDVECASCGKVAGRLSDKPSAKKTESDPLVNKE